MSTPRCTSLEERNQILKDDVYPFVVNLPNFLGNTDFGTAFYHYIRPGQTSWEFRNQETNDTFYTFLVGEVASYTDGTRLGAVGNLKPRKDGMISPIVDGTKVKNVLALILPTASSVLGNNAFNNQFITLEQISERVNAEDTKGTPSNGSSATWTTSTVACSESHRPADIILVSLPRKYNSPTATSSSAQRSNKRAPLKDDTETSTSVKQSSQKSMDDNVVTIGHFYEPSLQADFSPMRLHLIRDKLIQADISDLDGKLIPAWQIQDGLRPGTVVCVKATLHVFNIPNQNMPGFRRYYQINAEKIRVVCNPILPPSPFPERAITTLPTPSNHSTDELDRFRVQKCPISSATERETAKKIKTDPSSDSGDQAMND